MNISDLVEVLDDDMPHFDFIMFDACFMMSIEVAYAVRNYADYYMGCPTENPVRVLLITRSSLICLSKVQRFKWRKLFWPLQ